MITDADRSQLSLDPHPLLGGAGAGQVREVLVLVDVAEHGVGMVDAGCREQRFVQPEHAPGLGRFVDLERIHLVRRHPARVAVDLFISQLDRRGRQRARDLRGGNRTLGQSGSGVGRQGDIRGESPDAVVYDAN